MYMYIDLPPPHPPFFYLFSFLFYLLFSFLFIGVEPMINFFLFLFRSVDHLTINGTSAEIQIMDEIQELSPHPHGKKGMERERGGHIQVTVYLYATCWVSINRGGLPIVILFEILISYCPFEVDKMNINYVETCEQISVIINNARCLTSILVDVASKWKL